ncbi:putative LRR containing protein [Trachipleistophora hominis]|uniref:Putative LRR containing protein n=1 Tax=Trachipleistophora hominis TaxID=72359 RepID=L7JUA3_TRAHO|nr:putative LRR containing protein [Trachipleistophora hominis]
MNFLDQTSNILIRWILWFANESDDAVIDTILCDNLEDMNLENVFVNIFESKGNITLSEFKIADYDTNEDPLGICKSGKRKRLDDDSAMESKNDCTSTNETDKENDKCKYRMIHVPVAKSLFMKIVNLTVTSEVKFSDEELYNIIEHLLTFLKDKLPFLRVLAQLFLEDSELRNKLEAINSKYISRNDKKRLTKDVSFDIKFQNAIREVEYHFGLFVTDKHGNAAVVARNDDTCPLIHTDVCSLCYFFIPSFIRMDGYFLIYNHDILCEVYENLSSDFDLTVDVDFSDVFYEVNKSYKDNKIPMQILTEELNSAFECKFFTLDCLKTCIFRLRGVQSNPKFDAIPDKQLNLYCQECIFNETLQLPSTLKMLSISNSKICCNWTLPDTLEDVVFKKVEVEKNCKLNIGRACKQINITDSIGMIFIPYIHEIFVPQFFLNWSVELVQNGDVVEKLTVSNAKFMNVIICVPRNIRAITLKDVSMDNEARLTLPREIKEVILEDFRGNVQFEDFVQNGPSTIHFDNGTFRSSVTKESDDIAEVVLSNVSLDQNIFFLLNPLNNYLSYIHSDPFVPLRFDKRIKSIILCNCIGDVYFESMPYFGQLALGTNVLYERSKESIKFNAFENTQLTKLVISNYYIVETVYLGLEIEEIKFENIVVADSKFVVINRNFKRLVLSNIKGCFKIPGIVSDNESDNNEIFEDPNFLEIVNVLENCYDITMKSLSFHRLTIDMNLRTACFHNVKVSDELLIISQQCENLHLHDVEGPVSTPNITSYKTIKLFFLEQFDCSSILTATVEDFEAKGVVFSKYPCITPATKKISLHSVTCDAVKNDSILLSEQCDDIYILCSSISMNISSIVKNISLNISIYVATRAICSLVTSCSQNITKLKLSGNFVDGIWRIERDVNFISLLNISAEKGSILQLNENLESIRIEFSQVNVDVSSIKNLRAITLVNVEAFVYIPFKYTPVSYLRFYGVAINFEINLGSNLNTFSITRSSLTIDHAIIINRNISHLSVSKFTGVLEMSGVAGLEKVTLTKEHEIYFDKWSKRNKEGLLCIVNYKFDSSVIFSDDVSTIRLKNVETAPHTKLILNHGCKCLKINSSNVDIDYSRATLLKKVILKAMSSLILRILLTKLSSVNTLVLEDMIIEDKIRLPDYLHTVVLRQVQIADKARFSFNKECSAVHLYYCSGMYDLVEIENLEILSLIPGLYERFKFVVTLPSLRSVRELNIAYNINEECFRYYLSKCINLTSLSVHSLNYSKRLIKYPPFHFGIEDIFDFSDSNNPRSVFELSKYKSNRDEWNWQYYILINLKMNILMHELLTLNLRNKLKYLNLAGCALNKENLNMLKECANLRVLVVDCAFLDNTFFETIPAQLETLEILDCKIFNGVRLDIKRLSCRSLQLLRTCKNLKHLVLEGTILKHEHIAECLPVSLESLKVTRFLKDSVEFAPATRKKIVIKRLVLLLDDVNCYPPVLIDTNPTKRQYYQLFDSLRNIIDFAALENLSLEASGQSVNIDKETYRIK